MDWVELQINDESIFPVKVGMLNRHELCSLKRSFDVSQKKTSIDPGQPSQSVQSDQGGNSCIWKFLVPLARRDYVMAWCLLSVHALSFISYIFF